MRTVLVIAVRTDDETQGYRRHLNDNALKLKQLD
jgi:hypothetical protein